MLFYCQQRFDPKFSIHTSLNAQLPLPSVLFFRLCDDHLSPGHMNVSILVFKFVSFSEPTQIL